MARQILDITLENLGHAPQEALDTVFWEIDRGSDDPRFDKEQWFSSTLLEWGSCGKLLVDAEAVGFAEYAPPALYPRLGSFAAAPASGDAIYLAYCYLATEHRREGGGSDLVRAVARDLVDRGYRALEAVGDRRWDGSWVLPEGFLAACGFRVLREDERFPLMRLDLSSRAPALRAVEAAVTT